MLIVSLTTTQVRYLRLGGTINSLLSQKRKPDAIVLNISFDEPSIEQQYTSMGVIVNKTEDYGPITKLLPTLRLAKRPQERQCACSPPLTAVQARRHLA